MGPANTRSMVEGAMLSAITIIISLIALYVPVLGIFASLIWPVPIVILGIRHGLRTSILATAVAGIVVAMFQGFAQAFNVVLGFGLLGVVMGWAIRKKFSPYKVLFVGSGASLVSEIALIVTTIYIMGFNPMQMELSAMRDSITMVGNIYKNMGASPETVKQILESYGKILDFFAMAIPALLVMSSVVSAFLNYQVTKLILSRLGQKLEDFTPFWLWKLPDYTVFFFLLGVLMNLLEYYWPVGVLKSIGINLQLIFGFAFIIEGLSLVSYYMGRFNLNKILRVLFVFLIFFNPLVSQIVLWAGMFDILFNFRKI
ncbi:MAG TPA: YybS family protein [Thermoanaerobacterales bacterium]|nr:YybS family protein [Thermoanaerobacterales bacterium]